MWALEPLEVRKERPMDTSSSYGILKKSLAGTQARQEAIAGNLANINTRGYKANRVPFEEALDKAVKRSQRRGTKLSSELEKTSIETVKEEGTIMGNDKNNVDIDLEMANMAANQIMQHTLVELLNGRYRNMRMIINGGK